ncbi:putative phage tail X [uncultured Mediterranean phage uvMED]|nr:putative phage tail X [uncultured Mediterranean phage uvMED]BAR22569.1 hypothetical protein [uncultured Mediterranean phage uvMED]
MSEYNTKAGQTVFDLSLLLYGTASKAVQILKDNRHLGNLTKEIPSGTVISYTEQAGNEIVNFLSVESRVPNTGEGSNIGGSGFDSGFDSLAFR